MEMGSLRSSLIGTIVAAVAVTGCASAGKSTFDYSPPPTPPVENEANIPEDYGVVWNRLVEGLSKSFFVVNNIDKESHFINVSFSSNDADQFVTGGLSTRTWKNNVYKYDPAADTIYQAAWTWGDFNNLPSIGTFRRDTSLEGRINIYIAPSDGGTKVTVNCRYVLTVDVTGTYQAQNAFGGVVGTGATQPTKNTATFSTNQPNSTVWGGPAITFWSKGTLEGEVLGIARGSLPVP